MDNKKNHNGFRLFRFVLVSRDKRIIIYLICVAIATLFWFLNALGKYYTVELTYPVRYTNMPKNKILVNQLPSEFKLNVNSHGFTVLRHKLSVSFAPLVFDVNNLTHNRMESGKQTQYVIHTNQYLQQLSDQLSGELHINSISPDSLFFNFDQVIKKSVKVHPNVKIDFVKQFQLSGPITSKPDRITVFGPQSIVDTLRFIPTNFQHIKSVTRTIQRDAILSDIENLRIENKNVVMSIPVEEFTESQLLIPVDIENNPNGLNVKLFPNRVKLSFLVGLSRYSEILPKDFKLVVSCDEITPGKTRLKVETRKLPPFIKSIRINPEEVEYLIEK